MNKKYLALLSASLLLGSEAYAQGNITGTVFDKSTGETLDYATVTLEKAKSNEFVAATSTDNGGKYVFENIPDGDYIIKITFMGTVPQEREITISGRNIQVNPISLHEDAQMLKEVEVTGVRGQMRFELDRKVFNVDASIAAAGVSASELLESIPSVEVDQDGEVSLRGNSSVIVWINGKESGLTADNRTQILEQIPAESIERVEVITNPSAKYSPEGTAGIINIVLKQDRNKGYFGSAELSADTRGSGNANFNINVNSGKFDSYAGLGFRMRRGSGGSRSARTYDNGNYLNSESENRNNGNNFFMRLGTTFHMTDKDDFYFNGFGMKGHNWGRSGTDYVSNLPGQWKTNSNVSRRRGNMFGLHSELGYTHKWSTSHRIDLEGSYDSWSGDNNNKYTQEQLWADNTMSSVFQRQEGDMNNHSFEAKIDYENQLNDWLKLEAGYDGEFSKENSPTTTWTGTNESDATLAKQLYNRFIYTDNTNSLYFTLGGKFNMFSFSGGLRAEAWQIRTRSLEYGQSETDVPQSKFNKFSLFPSAYISWSLPYDNELQLNYTRRIRRPWGGMLNSFKDISNPTNISYGNPLLQPQYSNSLELNYIKSWDFHMISVSTYLRHSDGVMNRISFLDNDILYTTWANVGSQINSGAEIVSKNNIFKFLELTTTVNLYNSHLNAWKINFEQDGKLFPVSKGKQNSFAWDGRCMASIKLPWSISMQITGRYRSRQITAQGSREPGWNVDAGIRKTAGNWSFSVNCRDVFNSMKWHNFTHGDGYSQESESWRDRSVRFTIKYSFGNMKAKREDMPDTGEPMDGSGYSEME